MIKKLAGTFLAAGALLVCAAPAAEAAPLEPFTITEPSTSTALSRRLSRRPGPCAPLARSRTRWSGIGLGAIPTRLGNLIY